MKNDNGEQSSDTKTKHQKDVQSYQQRARRKRKAQYRTKHTHTHTPSHRGTFSRPPRPQTQLTRCPDIPPGCLPERGSPKKINKGPAEAKIPAQKSKSTNSPAAQLGGSALPGLYTSDTHRGTEGHTRGGRGALKSPVQVLSSLPNGISEKLGNCFRYQR